MLMSAALAAAAAIAAARSPAALGRRRSARHRMRKRGHAPLDLAAVALGAGDLVGDGRIADQFLEGHATAIAVVLKDRHFGFSGLTSNDSSDRRVIVVRLPPARYACRA